MAVQAALDAANVRVPESAAHLYCPQYAGKPMQFIDALMEGAVLPKKLTPCLPLDVNASPKKNINKGELNEAIRQLDAFGWQMFIALNWPVTQDGDDLLFAPSLAGPGNPRWYGWNTTDEAFQGKGGVPEPWHSTSDDTLETTLHILSDMQPSAQRLRDQHGRLVGFEIQMNKIVYDQIRGDGSGDLYTAEGQSTKVDRMLFPWGQADAAHRQVGSTVIKLAWKALDAQDHRGRFFKRKAVMPDDAVPGDPKQREFGLVGMHIGYKLSYLDSKWVWITFEHIDNVDDKDELDCPAPASRPLEEPLFYDKQCKHCPPNQPPPEEGRGRGPHGHPTQVVREARIREDTQKFNCEVRALLHSHAPKSPAQYYKLVAAQAAIWREKETKWQSVPPYALNTMLETYEQHSEKEEERGCVQCHLLAPRKVKGPKGGYIDAAGMGDSMYMLTRRLQIKQ
ncbi:hypothetical protein [Polyangium aurulentum]|uniref:hypothetical protein n=1 Tax=Polyangium aurulentum TaxID=2567896 RepID=UPI0010AE751E|nr:hypothetical protein [Polyangium aurulentum]UQA57516.1 hypothetical protein E8A73_040575 [Polyangium aurulentum]